MGLEIGMTKLSLEDRVGFFRTLSGWLNSGAGRMPVAEAVSNTCDAYSHDEYKSLRAKMELIAREVQGGQTRFYEALHLAEIGFEPQEIGIIRAAEESNQLRQTIPPLAQALYMQHTGRRNLISQMTMPIVVGFMLIGMSLGVLTIMLPMVIQPVLDRRPDSLEKFPIILQYYWHASVWLRANYMIPITIMSFPVVIFFLRNTAFLGPILERMKMNFSPTRRLAIAFNSVLTVYFLPALVRSGMPTYRALDELSNCIANPTISYQIRAAAQDHETGIRLGQSLDALPFRASFVNAVVSGEQTGAIAERVEELQDPYSIELERQIKLVVSKLKFMVMAVLLPFFIVSTYTSLVGPIFALMEY